MIHFKAIAVRGVGSKGVPVSTHATVIPLFYCFFFPECWQRKIIFSHTLFLQYRPALSSEFRSVSLSIVCFWCLYQKWGDCWDVDSFLHLLFYSTGSVFTFIVETCCFHHYCSVGQVLWPSHFFFSCLHWLWYPGSLTFAYEF